MKRRDRASAVFWLFFSGLILWQASRLPFGTLRRPRPGFYPTILGGILAALSILFLILSLRPAEKDRGQERLFSSSSGLRRVVLAVVALLMFYGFFEMIGFLICTFLFLVLLFKTVEPQKWIVSILASALISCGAYLLFETILKSNLPRGLFQGLGF